MRTEGGGWKGNKGGEMTVDAPGQHVLERTSCFISSQVCPCTSVLLQHLEWPPCPTLSAAKCSLGVTETWLVKEVCLRGDAGVRNICSTLVAQLGLSALRAVLPSGSYKSMLHDVLGLHYRETLKHVSLWHYPPEGAPSWATGQPKSLSAICPGESQYAAGSAPPLAANGLPLCWCQILQRL